MKKYRDPKKEKELDYKKQHFSPGKYDKAFRKQWPRKKAIAERKFRRVQSQALGSCVDGEFDLLDDKMATRREQVKKWHIENLKQRISRKKVKRELMVGARIARQNRN